MKRYYEFAGVELEVSIPDRWSFEDERMLSSFSVESVSNPHKFEIEVVDELVSPEGELKVNRDGFKIYTKGIEQQRYVGPVKDEWKNAYIRIVHRDKEHHVQIKTEACKNKIGVKLLLESLATEHLVLTHGGVIFHASFIMIDGKAILFTAPSGTGKSTQAELWKKYRGAEIINGDRAVIRVIDEKLYACGIPFAGSSQYCENKTVPLEAIVYLGQAVENTVRVLHHTEAFKRVWEGCTVNTWDQKDVECTFDIVRQAITNIPVYFFECTPDESAVLALEKILGDRKRQ